MGKKQPPKKITAENGPTPQEMVTSTKNIDTSTPAPAPTQPSSSYQLRTPKKRVKVVDTENDSSSETESNSSDNDYDAEVSEIKVAPRIKRPVRAPASRVRDRNHDVTEIQPAPIHATTTTTTTRIGLFSPQESMRLNFLNQGRERVLLTQGCDRALASLIESALAILIQPPHGLALDSSDQTRIEIIDLDGEDWSSRSPSGKYI